MISENFVILGALISFIGSMSYVRDVLKGKAKPNRATWFLWALAPMIAFSAELDSGVGLRSLMTFMVGFNPALIFIASFINKQAYWKLTRLDYICAVLSLIGLGLWLASGEGNVAIIFAIVADGLAAVPTLVKSFKYPETENYHAFLGGLISSVLALLTIDIWSLAHWGFPLYILVINTIFVVFIRGRVGLITGKKTAVAK